MTAAPVSAVPAGFALPDPRAARRPQTGRDHVGDRRSDRPAAASPVPADGIRAGFGDRTGERDGAARGRSTTFGTRVAGSVSRTRRRCEIAAAVTVLRSSPRSTPGAAPLGDPTQRLDAYMWLALVCGVDDAVAGDVVAARRPLVGGRPVPDRRRRTHRPAAGDGGGHPARAKAALGRDAQRAGPGARGGRPAGGSRCAVRRATLFLTIARSRRGRRGRRTAPATTVLVTGTLALPVATTVAFVRRHPAAARICPRAGSPSSPSCSPAVSGRPSHRRARPAARVTAAWRAPGRRCRLRLRPRVTGIHPCRPRWVGPDLAALQARGHVRRSRVQRRRKPKTRDQPAPRRPDRARRGPRRQHRHRRDLSQRRAAQQRPQPHPGLAGGAHQVGRHRPFRRPLWSPRGRCDEERRSVRRHGREADRIGARDRRPRLRGVDHRRRLQRRPVVRVDRDSSSWSSSSTTRAASR